MICTTITIILFKFIKPDVYKRQELYTDLVDRNNFNQILFSYRQQFMYEKTHRIPTKWVFQPCAVKCLTCNIWFTRSYTDTQMTTKIILQGKWCIWIIKMFNCIRYSVVLLVLSWLSVLCSLRLNVLDCVCSLLSMCVLKIVNFVWLWIIIVVQF